MQHLRHFTCKLEFLSERMKLSEATSPDDKDSLHAARIYMTYVFSGHDVEVRCMKMLVCLYVHNCLVMPDQLWDSQETL